MTVGFHKSPAPAKGTRAFTIVELLVSMVVLGIIVVLCAQLLTEATSTTTKRQNRMDTVAQAQLVLDRLAFDFQAMPLRGDFDYSFTKLVGNDELAFYSAGEGLQAAGGVPRGLSVIGYRVRPHGEKPLLELERGARQLDWSGGQEVAHSTISPAGLRQQRLSAPNSLPAVSTTGTNHFEIFADQVFRFEFCFKTKGDPNATPPLPGEWVATPPASIDEIAGVTVGIAVLDRKSRALVADDTSLVAAFPDAVDGQDILSLWRPILNDSGLARTADIPPPAAQAIRVYQKSFLLKH